MLLAAMVRARRRAPLPLLGAWVLFISLAAYIGHALAGYPDVLSVPFLKGWPELILLAPGGRGFAGGLVGHATGQKYR